MTSRTAAERSRTYDGTYDRTYTVLHLVNDVDTGGAQTLIESLAAHRPADVRMSLCVLSGRGRLADRLEAVCDEVVYLGFDRRSWNLPRLARDVRAVVHRVRPDVLHSHLLQSDLAALLVPRSAARVRVSTLHTTGLTGADPARSRVLGGVVGLLSRGGFDRVVACDPSCEGYARRMGYSWSRAAVIPNGVAVPDAPPSADLPDGAETPAMSPLLLSLARWHPMKDHATLLAAFARLRADGVPARLRLAGGGMDADNPELAQLLAEHGVAEHVELLGARDDVADLLAGSHALVIASAYGEALPMAGIEALAAGRPVVATDVGGCRSLVVEPSHLVPSRDPARLASALAEVLAAGPDETRKLRRRARELAAQRFDVRGTLQAYDEVYRQALATRAAPAAAPPGSRSRGRVPHDAPESAVVCVTPRGGHLEHAFNLASAVAEHTGRGCLLVSRKGASDYLPEPPDGVRLIELRREFLEEPTLLGKVRRTLREVAEVHAILSAPGLRRVVVEEPHMVLGVPWRRGLDAVAVVHNVQEHDAGDRDLAGLLREALKSFELIRAKRVVVHGQVQKDGLPRWVRPKVRVIPALGAGQFEAATLREVPKDASAAGSLLCIGALRRNKNLQEAVVAAARARRRLLLAGEAIEPDYFAELQAVIQDLGGDVEVRSEFLSAGRFEALLRTADAVLLPYASFLAQSGVLERALVIGTPVVSADLPSLREQAGDRDGVLFYPPGDVAALVRILEGPLPETERRHEAIEPDPRWKQCAEAVL